MLSVLVFGVAGMRGVGVVCIIVFAFVLLCRLFCLLLSLLLPLLLSFVSLFPFFVRVSVWYVGVVAVVVVVDMIADVGVAMIACVVVGTVGVVICCGVAASVVVRYVAMLVVVGAGVGVVVVVFDVGVFAFRCWCCW